MEFGAFVRGQQLVAVQRWPIRVTRVGKALRCRALTGMRNSVGQRRWPPGQASVQIFDFGRTYCGPTRRIRGHVGV